jgi:prepilin-type N-terminal cleavage/methylation domain-containing protein
MPTSATPAALRRRLADRPAPRPTHCRRCQAGFTLIEVLIALGIIALMAAVVVPGLARRLDTAFQQADLQQVLSSARLLPARVATLGIDLTLDAAALDKPLPDGNPPLDLPSGWTVRVESPARLAHSGTCVSGALVVQEPTEGRRWRVGVARLSCEIAITELDAAAP